VASPADGDAARTWFRVGMRRLGEVGQPQAPKGSLLPERLNFHFGQGNMSNGMLTAMGALLALAVVAIPLCFAGLSWHVPSPAIGTATTSGNFQESGRFGSASASANLQETIRRLPGATAMVLPEVVCSLKLTKDQQEQIRHIVDAADQAIQRFDSIAQLEGRPREQISRCHVELHDEARRQALKLLSDRQQARWKKIVGESPDH
jgi:hypothetical protein